MLNDKEGWLLQRQKHCLLPGSTPLTEPNLYPLVAMEPCEIKSPSYWPNRINHAR